MLHRVGSGLMVDTSGNRIPTKSVLFCRMTPFIITWDVDIDNFPGRKVDAIYQADDQYFNFFKEQVKELQTEKSQSIITSVFELLQVLGTKLGGGRLQESH